MKSQVIRLRPSYIKLTCSVVLLLACVSSNVGPAYGLTTINEFLTGSPTIPGAWYETAIADSGTASIVDLTGAGGNLETAQPLGVGAALLTTINTNPSRAQVGTAADFGDAATVLGNIDLAYDFYKTTPSANAAAAPSLKIGIFSPTGTGDNFGQLVWEYSNQGLGATPANTWTNVTLDETSGGGGNDSVGGWWWTGGFEIGSGGGGAPFRSLTEWVSAFQTADVTDFGTARIVGFDIGIGTFNPDQIDYFDNLVIDINDGSINFHETWDFEPILAVAAVPEPSSLILLGLGSLFLQGVRRRRRAS